MASTGEQIARMAGYSNSTVSRVLNNSGTVSDETRKSILEAVRASGTVPRILGPRRLTRSRQKPEALSGLIDVVMIRHATRQNAFFDPQNRFANSYFRHLVDAVIQQMQGVGYHAIVRVCEQPPEQLATHDAAAMLLLGDYRQGLESYVRGRRHPVVSFIAAEDGTLIDYVGIDNLSGISAGFDHLWQLGHRKIGYIAGSQLARVMRDRYAAYRLKLADAGLPLRSEWVFVGHCDRAEDEAAAEEILRHPDRPTAMLCCYDGAAIAVRRAAETLGLSIPDDLSVVGFDDQGLEELFSPPLTTVRVPVMQMAKHAVDLLMMRLRQEPEGQLDPCGVRVMPTLIVRKSTAPPAQHLTNTSSLSSP